ncbi:hypothetical protein COR50_18980 [Chitinophaga caeni]|uniref:DUF4932 domain-containing protein n=1 Tax=Chitinophaga caeni TaxID=2029983 RepID=A0A291QYQ9_9BACT|nr:DUF4932 domain-containing protein [Chitinophaga caeni]ATL49085.1 hypothetical protein COR50_18980 [Chitinophaga caeni]
MRNIVCLTIALLMARAGYTQAKFTVNVDSRFEAISIFYTLATQDTLETKPTPSRYYRDFMQYFQDCKLHPALNWYRNLDSWDGYDIASLGIFLSKKAPFALIEPLERNYIRSSHLDTFLNRLNRFYKDCNVSAFIEQHQPLYREVCKAAEDTIRKSGILQDLERFYGSHQQAEFRIYLDLLNNLGNNAIVLNNPKYRGVRISRLAYLSEDTDSLTNESPVVFKPYINVVAHECSHVYLESFITTYHDRVYAIRKLFLETSNGKTLEEDEWENEADELVVRVAVACILKLKYGTEAGRKEIENQSFHFKWAKKLYQFFDQYITQRSRYKTIEDFYPEIIKWMEQEYKS